MKKLVVACLLFFAPFARAQTIISIDPYLSFTPAQIDSVLSTNGIPTTFLDLNYSVDIYRVLYNTISYDSVTPTYASGALLVPQGPPCKIPLLSYQHGTTSHRHGVASYFSGEVMIGLSMASSGYAVSMPDYLGLGDGPGFHPYVHARSEASASLDMLRAVREAQDSIPNFDWNTQLFLVGYSQGGHATMALQRLIETQYSQEFPITASAPMSGPYDVSGVQAAVITNDSVYSQPGYLPYILTAYNMVYGFYNSASEVLIPPYDTLLPPLLDGFHDMGALNAAMPAIPNQILIPAVLDSFRTDPNHYFRHALRDNDVYDWKPTAPTRMYFCEADDEVYYLNAQVAYDKFIENGSTSVSLQSAGEDYDHFTCALFALLTGKNWFDSLRADVIELEFEVVDASSSLSNGSLELIINGGAPPFEITWSTNDTTSIIDGLAAGDYNVTVTDANGCSGSGSASVSVADNIINLLGTGNIKVYPNPFSEETTIQFDLPLKDARLSITDMNGKTVKDIQVAGNSTVQIQAGELKPGIYFLSITEQDQLLGNIKLAITR